jgi:nucleoside-diphosphate-sugar epimerase
MLQRGARVIGTSRHPDRLRWIPGLEAIKLDVSEPFSLDIIPGGALVLHSIPPVDEDNPESIPKALGDRPARVVYLSTTGVYGDQKDVDASTSPSRKNPREQQRLAAETAISVGPWSSMILRPAAIYGPGRGVHVSMKEGRFRLVGSGENFVSRIHVDDLATHVEAALLSDIAGAWPVADDYPCTSREIAAYCSDLLNVPMPETMDRDQAHPTRRADRRVDGHAVRDKLGIRLAFPSYREGIPASLQKA